MLQRPYNQVITVISFVVGIVFMNAWITDDASITLRTIFHFLNGYGPNFNADIRVQSYTHPLWMLLLSLVIALTQEYYFTTILVSLVCTTGALLLLHRLADPAHSLTVIAALAILSLSKSFIEYSTSGLENSLGHLLLAALCVVVVHRDRIAHPLRWLGIILAGIVLNRQDYVLLVAPLVAYTAIVWRTDTPHPWRPHITHTLRNVADLSLCLVPLVLWFGFSTFYYGSPFPNTAYAKLNTFIERDALVAQGLIYVLNTIKADPLVLGIIGMSIISAWYGRQPLATLLIAGIGLYTLYIVSIGGDFMVGRFFTGIVFLGVIVIIISKPSTPLLLSMVVPLALIGILSPLNPWYAVMNTPDERPKAPPSGVVDERLFYTIPRSVSVSLFNQTRYGILNPYIYINSSIDKTFSPRPSEYYLNRDNHFNGTIGIVLGPKAVLIDRWALFDPLIARLPATYTPYWRTGHFGRSIPIGYMESLQSGNNQIADPGVAALYDALHIITQGPLWSTERMAAIVRLNTGYYDHSIDIFHYQFPDAMHVNLTEIAYLDETDFIPVGFGGLVVHLDTPNTHPVLTVAHRGDISWTVWFSKGSQRIAALHLPKKSNSEALLTSTLTIPDTVRQSGYDTIHILIDLDAYEILNQPSITSALGRITLADEENAPLPTLANATMERNSTTTQPARIRMILRWNPATTVVSDHEVTLTLNEQVVQRIPNNAIDGTTIIEADSILAAGFNRFAIVATSNGIPILPPDIIEFTVMPNMSTASALDIDSASLPIALGTGWYDQDAQWSVIQADIHARWYRLNLAARGRWAQSPQFDVVTSQPGTHTLTITVSQLVQPQGLATSAPIELIINGQPQPVTLQVGTNQLSIPLQTGINTVHLKATAPSQDLATLIPGSNDLRVVDMRITSLAVQPKTALTP